MFPKTGRRGDDLSTLLDQTPDFAPICFNVPRPERGLLVFCPPKGAVVRDVYSRTEVLEFVASVKQNQKGSWWKMVLVAVVVMPAGSKLPAAVVVRISMGEIRLGRRSEHIGSGSTRSAEQLSPCIACTAVAVPSVRSRVLVFAGPSASMARRGCQASCYRRVKR